MNPSTLISRIRRTLQRVFFWLPSSEVNEEHPPEVGHDHALVIAVTEPQRLPRYRQFRYALRVFDPSERRLLVIACLIAVIALGTAGFVFAKGHIVNVPVVGGAYSEALIGQPKFINPLDAPANDVDADLVRLVYSGLFRMDGLNPIPDIAQSYEWSDDRKTLTIHLRPDVYFHDGQLLTADDVRFTFDSLMDPARKSPLAAEFHGVTVSTQGDDTVIFTLDRPDAQILSSLTFGILPAHLWEDVSAANARVSDLNLKPIGSGPYHVKSFLRDNNGNIHSYTLERFDRYYGFAPYLKTVVFQFYPDRQSAVDAAKADLVEGAAFVPTADAQKAESASRAHDLKLELPEETVAFFDLKDGTLKDKDVRTALSLAVDRPDLVDALGGGATPVMGPYPFLDTTTTGMDVDRARTLLENDGWVLPQNGNIRIAKSGAKDTSSSSTAPIATASSTELSLTISVADEPDLLTVADRLKRQWSLIGAKVDIETLSTEDLLRKATRDRDGQIILLNVYLGPTQDLFPFWWSGQAIDRGYNFSSLVDRTVDDALEASRDATTTDAIIEARQTASAAILNDVPAVFLLRPMHHEIVATGIKGVQDHLLISSPADRLGGLMSWYTNSGWRWK